MNPLSTSRNKYHQNVKDSTVYTPEGVCNFLHELLWGHVAWMHGDLVDCSVGSGNLVRPFLDQRDVRFVGYDIDDHPDRPAAIEFRKENFLSVARGDDWRPCGLAVCNPPFNTDRRNKDWLAKNKLGKALLPELFALKVFELWGSGTPLVLFTPMGFRLNLRRKSTRQRRFLEDCKAQITSIISLPLDIFSTEGHPVEFHNEILIWNVRNLKPHYWLPTEYY